MNLENPKILIAYFSHAGENYVNGAIKKLSTGNTRVAAEILQTLTGGDLFFLDTVIPYPDNHMEKINIAKNEQEQNARPELTAYVSNMDVYDLIFLCYPNWWGTCPMAVFTFLETYQLAGKHIAPLCTHEGSGLGHSISDIASACPDAILTDGLAIRGGKVNESDGTIKSWLNSL